MLKLDKKKRKKKRGYKKVYEDESGSTSLGRKKVVGTYRPRRRLQKNKDTTVIYKDGDSPRTRFTEKYVVKKRKDGTKKSEKNIIRKNFKIIKDPKVKKK